MADFGISADRYSHRPQNSQPAAQKPTAPQEIAATKETETVGQAANPAVAPKEKAAESARTPAEDRLEQYQNMLNRIQEQNRRRLEEQKRAKPPKQKRPPPETIRMKIAEIRSKLRNGGRLSVEDKQYLSKYDPAELERLQRAELARLAFQAELRDCKSQEETDQAYQSACTAAMGASLYEPDLSAVTIGQLDAVLRETPDKPTDTQLQKQDSRRHPEIDRKA